jgi:hypothetical protein
MRTGTPRDGFAMLLVVVFLALVLSVYSLSHRHLATVLRVETARVAQQERDEGSLRALAAAVALLETGLPPEDPYVCGVVIDTSAGERSFTITYLSDGADEWQVTAVPTGPYEDPQPMPDSFAEPSEPPGPVDKPPKPVDKPPGKPPVKPKDLDQRKPTTPGGKAKKAK